MNRAKSPCKRPGCRVLLDLPGYCPDHQPDIKPRERFAALDERKTDPQRKFYSSGSWTAASKRHRAIEPLCRRCRSRGRVEAAVLVHHNPPLEDLLRDGKNPLNEDYLESLCLSCHQKELYLHRVT